MKKLIILFFICFCLTGCTNNIDTTTTVIETGTTETIEYITDEIPVYSGTKIIILNNNIPNLNKEDANTVFETYSELDEFGRCGVAYANICTELMPTEERGEIGHIKPSGWYTIKYDCVDCKYLYNRCHLIAFCLAGENDNELNLITGTRSFNVDSMLYYEDMILDYMKENPNNHVLYKVTPIYIDDELVCRGVQMEALSIEDDTICFNVFCYNVQDNITIDYKTGNSWLTNDDSNMEEPTTITTNTDGITYMININTKKIHTEDCKSIKNTKEENKEMYNGPLDYLLNQGYEKCKNCNP